MKLKNSLIGFWHSFQVRVFLSLTLVILIVIPATGYFCYLKAREVVERQMQQYSLGTAAQISKRVESFLSQHTDNVKLIKSFFENQLIDLNNDKEILQYFYLFKKDHPEFVNIYLGDQLGRFLMAPAQIPEVHKIFDPRVRPWYSGAMNSSDAHWTKVYLFASTLKPGMTVSVPIYDKQKNIKAVCGIDIDISSISKFLQGIKIGNQGVAYIFENTKGRVIAHPSLIKLPWDPGQIELLRTCLMDLNKKNKTFGTSFFKGEQFFTAYTDYPSNNWTVGVTLPVSDFIKNILDIKRAIITLVIMGILFSSLLSYLLAKTIVSPLNILKKGIEKISGGNLSHKVNIKDPDIAADLAGAFNQMASSLETSTKELKQTYAELAQKEKLAAVGQMTAGIAHEIKNPLGIIQGSAQVVANKNRPMEMREKAADFIMEEVERLNHTLTSFLDFAKPASPEFKPTNITDLADEMIVSIQESFAVKGWKIKTAFPPQAPFIQADAEQIRQVFWNIILNSAQSMPDGGTIHIATGQTKENGREYSFISIADTGCGIDKTKMKKIMDPFVSFRDNGIGLGLSIVSQIVKAHKGEVIINSTQGRGSSFKLLFPVSFQENSHAG